MPDYTIPRSVRTRDRELQLLQTFIDAGHVSLWREDNNNYNNNNNKNKNTNNNNNNIDNIKSVNNLILTKL